MRGEASAASMRTGKRGFLSVWLLCFFFITAYTFPLVWYEDDE